MLRKLIGKLIAWATPPAAAKPEKPKRNIRRDSLMFADASAPKFEIVKYVPMPGVVPASAKDDTLFMAMDNYNGQICNYANEYFFGQGFPGYPLLAELTQRSEYRSPSETMAKEMTRRWIRLRAHGDGDLSEKLDRIKTELERHKVQDLFRVATEQDGFFGRSQIYIDIRGIDENDDKRKLPLIIDKATIKKGSLKGFKNIEPIWTTPYLYNSTNPLAPDFFKPTSWFVLGKQTHASRLLTFVSRPVPDLLKPSYNFGGMSMSQLMIPYVEAWIRTRDSVSDIISSFSTSGIKTNMGDVLTGAGADQLALRADLYNATKDNKGLLFLDNSDPTSPEEFFQFNVNLSSLDKLQAQAQEHQAAPSHLPLVKLLGISPAGLNASAEPELDVFYDFVSAEQIANYKTPLTQIIKIIQLDVWGEIDDAIGFEFESLKQLDGTALAAIRKSDADAAVALINASVISQEEERARLIADPNSGYDSLIAEELPELPGDPDADPGDGAGARDVA